MLNHTYTSVKNANLVDCGKKQHISSQPFPLLKDNFLGEFRTELEKKKVLANLGIASELSLEWEYIKGDIARSEALVKELDSRTKYISQLDGFTKNVTDGIQYLETIVGGEQEGEDEQNKRIEDLEKAKDELVTSISTLSKYISETVDINIQELNKSVTDISKKVENITDLINVSTKPGNALTLLTSEDVSEGETPGLYVPDLSKDLSTTQKDVKELQDDVSSINQELESFVTKEELGGGDFNFVTESTFNTYTTQTSTTLTNIQTELNKTVKTGEDGHVDTLYVNTISKNNNEESIKITDSFDVQSGIPLDVRFVVKSLEELHSLKPLVCYAGMGVIVSDQASLYILRQPANGIIDEEYIADKDGINWKCPEDLVIEVLTQEEYNAKVESNSINPHMFYYIHEEVTEEPQRKDFSSDEAYAEALDKWLRVLQQKYMSAVWGQEIESLVASKASNTAVKSLETEIQRLSKLIDTLSGGSNEVNLKDLNDQVTKNRTDLDTLIKEDGTIPTIQKDLESLQTSVSEEYVTKNDITTDNPDVEYIFVKKTAFDEYKHTHDEAIAQKVTSKEINTEQITLNSDVITTDDSNLLFNDEKIALDKQVPVIELIDNNVYEKLEETDPNKYYYVYDLEERYLLDSEFIEYKTSQGKTNQALSESVSNNKLSIGQLSNLTTENKNTLVYAINELHTYISRISNDLDTLITGEGIISSMQEAINSLSKEISEKYVTIESITKEDPSTEYIFLKKSEFDTYQTNHNAELAKQVTTEQVTTNKVVLGTHTVTTDDSNLLFDEETVAFLNQIPLIEVLDNATYDAKEEKDENVYYMVYDTEERYVPDSEFTEYKTSQTQVVENLSTTINKNTNSIGELINLTTDNKNTLVLAINELVNKINTLTAEIQVLKEQLNNSEPIE